MQKGQVDRAGGLQLFPQNGVAEDAIGKIFAGDEHRHTVDVIVHLVHIQQRRSLRDLKNIGKKRICR